jgi:hypothetical protein
MRNAFKKAGKWGLIWLSTNMVCYWSMWGIRAIVAMITQDPKTLAIVFAATFPITFLNEIGLAIYAGYRKVVNRLRDKARNDSPVAHSS